MSNTFDHHADENPELQKIVLDKGYKPLKYGYGKDLGFYQHRITIFKRKAVHLFCYVKIQQDEKKYDTGIITVQPAQLAMLIDVFTTNFYQNEEE